MAAQVSPTLLLGFRKSLKHVHRDWPDFAALRRSGSAGGPAGQGLSTGAGPGLYTNVMATEVYIKAFVDGRLGYSSAVGVLMAAIMVTFGLVYLRVIARRDFAEAS